MLIPKLNLVQPYDKEMVLHKRSQHLFKICCSNKEQKELKLRFKRSIRDENEEELKAILQDHSYYINKKKSDAYRTPYIFEIMKFCSFSFFLYILNELSLNINIKDLYSDKILHRAARLDRSDIIEYLCSKRIYSVDLQNDYGCTALHKAARYNSINSCKILLKYFINKEITDKQGKTALDDALMLRHLDCAYVIKRYNE